MTTDGPRTRVDASWVQACLLELLRTPTGVPAEQTEIEPGDPTIVAAVEGVLRPLVDALAPDEVRAHPAGDLAARFGPPGDDGVLLQTYVVSQHGDPTDDPSVARVVDRADGPHAMGQGASQNKGPMVAALAAVRERPGNALRRPVWLTFNTEGRSSHGGSRRILDDLGVRAGSGVVVIGTDLRVSVGNRGRVDVRVTVPGESCHSSQPWLGTNPIEGAADVVQALRTLPLPAPHPALGPASATPYQVSCAPVAPHTIPQEAVLTVDRRLLPGEQAADAVDALRAHLHAAVGSHLLVEEGASMLPAEVAADAPHVAALCAATEELAGRPAPPVWSPNTFDAGYACSLGIPTCMYGPGKRSFSKAMTTTETVRLADCVVAADALLRTVEALCT